MKKIILISVTIFLMAGAVYSSTYWGAFKGYGDPVAFTSARSAAMGNTNIANEETSLALFVNPALLTLADKPQFNYLLTNLYLREDRAFPTYDDYYNKAGLAIYVSNSRIYSYPAFALNLPFKKLSFGVGFTPVIDNAYKYLEIVRDTTYLKLGENIVETTGGISAISIGAALKLSEKIRLGAAFNQNSGSYDKRVSTVPFSSGSGTGAPYIFSRDIVDSLSGSNATAGISYYIRNRINISLNYKTEMKLSGTSSGSYFTGARNITYPSSTGLGIKYQPENPIPVVLSFDAISTAWSKLTDTPYADTRLIDVVEYHIGIEHRFDKGLPVRFGFAYVPHYTDVEVRDNYLTMGTGFESGNVTIDLGLIFKKSTYQVKDIFAGYHATKPSTITYDTVIDSTMGLTLGLGYKW